MIRSVIDQEIALRDVEEKVPQVVTATPEVLDDQGEVVEAATLAYDPAKEWTDRKKRLKAVKSATAVADLDDAALGEFVRLIDQTSSVTPEQWLSDLTVDDLRFLILGAMTGRIRFVSATQSILEWEMSTRG